MQKHFFQTSYPEVLRDVTTSIIAQIPEVGQSTDLDKADELVRLLNELLHLSWPAFTLWQGYFFSTSQNEWGRADALYAYEGVQKLALRNLRTIVEQLLSLHSVSQVQHFLELLLQYDQRSALPIITSLLLSMQCSEGNLGAAVEVLHFATDLKLRLSYNSMLRLQQLLHHRRVPLPQQLLHLKYLKASHAHKKLLPEYKF
ncbi:hypothetical protein FHG87_009378 [Trinorchestia longiramus]|nr:hypothetical protein FHG87_009378 [Trinorchestia longiramus]